MSFTPPEPAPSDPNAQQPFSQPAPTPTSGAAPQYGEYAAQPPAYPDAPQQAYYAPPAARSKTLGVVAFIAGLFVLIASPIASAFVGNAIGHVITPGTGFSGGFTAGQTAAATDPKVAAFGLLAVTQVVLGTLIGVWALVQGIIATRMNRGRVFGILAIVFAGVAPILSFIIYIATGVSTSVATH